MYQKFCEYNIKKQNNDATCYNGIGAGFADFECATFNVVSKERGNRADDKRKEKRLYETVPYVPFLKICLYAICELRYGNEVSKNGNEVATKYGGADTKSNQNGHKEDEANQLREYEEVAGVDAHDFKCVNLLGYSHSSNFGGYV